MGLEGDDYRDLEGAFESFLGQAGPALVLCGRVVYEIVYLVDRATGNAAAFQLVQVAPCSHWQRRRHEVQYVPGSQEGRRGRLVRLDRSRLLVASFPPSRLRQLTRTLAALDAASGWSVSSAMLQQEAMFNGLPYDFSVRQRYLDVAVARSTSALGWDARWSFSQRQLEPYRVWRQLQFEAFKIEVRDILISALNEALQKIGRRMGWTAMLNALGLPTMEDIRQAEEDLHAGSCPIEEIFGRFLWRPGSSERPEGSSAPAEGGVDESDQS